MRDIIAAGLEELGLSQRVPPEAPELLEAYGRALLEKTARNEQQAELYGRAFDMGVELAESDSRN